MELWILWVHKWCLRAYCVNTTMQSPLVNSWNYVTLINPMNLTNEWSGGDYLPSLIWGRPYWYIPPYLIYLYYLVYKFGPANGNDITSTKKNRVITNLYLNKSNRYLATNKAIWGGPSTKKKTIQDLYELHIIICYYLATKTLPWFHSGVGYKSHQR